MLTHKNLVSDCYIAQTNLTVYSTDVFYALLPIHHSYTMQAVFIESMSTGAEVVFGKSMAVSRMLRELKEGKITMLLGVPLLFNKLLAGILKGIKEKGPIVNGLMKFLMGVSFFCKKVFKVNPGKKIFKAVLEKASISTLRVAICGGGPLAPSVFRVYQELGIDFIQGYGLTETSPIIALNPVEHFKIESVGKFFAPYMDMRIADPDENGVGEVQVKGSMVMKGYYNMPEETAEVFTEDGWFKTGDLGKLDDENYLYLAGRAKNMIVTEGGKTVEYASEHTQFDKTSMLNVSIPKQSLDKVSVKFKYQIKVENQSEIPGYAKEIKDHIPAGLKFVEEDNKEFGWKLDKDGVITTDYLKDTILNPGESAEVTVILTWINGENNLGTKVNFAEISEDYNDYGTPDIDSTPDNFTGDVVEDDEDKDVVMLQVRTGSIDTNYIIFAVVVVSIIATGAILIKKYV